MDIKREVRAKGPLRRAPVLTLLIAALLAILLLLQQRNAGEDPAQLPPLVGDSSTSTPHAITIAGEMSATVAAASLNGSVSGWHPPNATWITDLDDVINGTGVHGFIFNGSQLPDGVPYGTYNWCNMPHVRASEYPRVSDEYQLEYVEVIHRHHKRTPYASSLFPVEPDPWHCNDAGLIYSGVPLNPPGNASARTYWSLYTSPVNPFNAPNDNSSTCQFPQQTRGGLDDSWQHGRDIWGVYHDLLSFLPSTPYSPAIQFRVTNNVITSQVASMLIAGMISAAAEGKEAENSYTATTTPIPLSIQPSTIDSLEPRYSCPAASALLALYGPGSKAASWQAHLRASRPLFDALDAVSGVTRTEGDDEDDEWHQSWDHYFDNLSARLCHGMTLPCNLSSSSSSSSSSVTANQGGVVVGGNGGDEDDDDDDEGGEQQCVTQAQASAVFRLGQHEYSYLWRDTHESLAVAAAAYGVWIAELAANIRSASASASAAFAAGGGGGGGDENSQLDAVRYRHNVAHDGSVARLLAVLQVAVMVWPGMGAEIVFEVYSNRKTRKSYVRVLWGGQVLRSSHPHLGALDMLDADVFLAYLDRLVGRGASRVPGLCGLEEGG